MPSYLLIVIAYLAGSIPIGLVIGKVFFKLDIRQFGSGNIGASNVHRVLGKPAGLAAFALDVLKGLIPVLAAKHWYPSETWVQVITGLAAIAGHNNSIFLKFTGGKGVATSCGVTIALSWKAAAAGFILWGAITFLSGYISLGSIISAPVAGFLIWKLNHESLPYGLFGVLVAVSVIYKHRSNIDRLRRGNELSIRANKRTVKNEPTLILASASPRRKELLAHLNVPYTVIPSSVDEPALIAQLGEVTPQKLVEELALAKALDIYQSNKNAVVIGADTVVVLDGKVLGKPADPEDAANMLSLLNGKTHEVFTGIAVVASDGTRSDSVRTLVTFRDLSRNEIEHYIATGEPMDKAGSYGIQNREISPVKSIEGDYYNVVGLPIVNVRDLLIPYFESIALAPEQPILNTTNAKAESQT